MSAMTKFRYNLVSLKSSLWLVVVLSQCPVVRGERILLLAYPWVSAVNALGALGDELVDRQHEVYMTIADNFPIEKLPKLKKEIKFITFKPKYPDLMSSLSVDPEDFFNAVLKDKSPIVDFRYGYDSFLGSCRNMLEDQHMEEEVKRLNFDMVILPTYLIARCLYVIPYKLDLPYISVTTDLEPWLNRNPQLPSFVPFQMQYPSQSEKMDFWERVNNLLEAVKWVWWTDQVPMASPDLVKQYAPNKPPVSINYLAGQSVLWLLENDPAIDYPRPMMPNEVNMGGLTTRPAKPLPADLEKFVAAAKQGVVILSFGSSPFTIQSHMLKILEGLKMVSKDYHFIIRWHLPDLPSVPSNMLLKKYIPQQDILGHPKTKLFLTHAGVNSQFEALYHAVPMLNFPVLWDQPYDAKRSDYHGISQTIDINNFSPQDVYLAVVELLENSDYKEKIEHRSAIYRAQAMRPRERAAFWIEHVITHGGRHLRAHALDMPAYQYLMMDILVFLLALVAMGAVVTYALFNMLKKCIAR